MRCGERIVDIDVGELGQLLRHGRVVGFLAGMEPGVLQHQHVAGGKGSDGRLRFRPDTIARECYRTREHDAERISDRAE